MTDAQVDMFEVQLGSAILVQMRVRRQVVTVLVDAGIFASGYADEHVRDKLPEALDHFKPGNRRIDLIIGSHYDRDHLAGLVPIIRDASYDIGEVWLPPVRDDRPKPPGARSRARPLLADQFAASSDEIGRYLGAKQADCEFFASRTQVPSETGPDGQFADVVRADLSATAPEPRDTPVATDARAFFENHLRQAQASIEQAGGDLDSSVEVPGEAMAALLRVRGSLRPRSVRESIEGSAFSTPPDAGVAAANLAFLRASSAHDAISAIVLNDVVSALRDRGTPMAGRTIAPGRLQRFEWSTRSRRFSTDGQPQDANPSIALLGPSDGLVKKHAERLPPGHYAAAARLATIPIKGITASNELSYVVRVDFRGQRLLLCGDTGMVDFRRGRTQWHRKLVDELRDLDLVQVAHHAGRNAYFYRALLEGAEAGRSRRDEYYLLSHATHDRTRPSAEFATFVGERARSGRRARLLFTSTPDPGKVQTYRSLVEPVVGASAASSDVRLSWSRGSDAWSVDRHGVAAS